MSRLQIAKSISEAPKKSQPLLSAVEKQLGRVPNMMRLLASSPSALEGYLNLSGALAKGSLPIKCREAIALAIAGFNGCQYCLSAHSYVSENAVGIDKEEIRLNMDGNSKDERTQKGIHFALKVAGLRGQVDAKEIEILKESGFSEAEILEIVVNVSLNILTNYVNEVAKTDIDFPEISHLS